jgi:hypothetical protein
MQKAEGSFQMGIQTPIDAGATEVLLGGELKPLLPMGRQPIVALKLRQ